MANVGDLIKRLPNDTGKVVQIDHTSKGSFVLIEWHDGIESVPINRLCNDNSYTVIGR